MHLPLFLSELADDHLILLHFSAGRSGWPLKHKQYQTLVVSCENEKRVWGGNLSMSFFTIIHYCHLPYPGLEGGWLVPLQLQSPVHQVMMMASWHGNPVKVVRVRWGRLWGGGGSAWG